MKIQVTNDDKIDNLLGSIVEAARRLTWETAEPEQGEFLLATLKETDDKLWGEISE